MEFLTTYYRRQGERSVSLLLQQYAHRGEQVCFACLCKADNLGEGNLRRSSETQVGAAAGYMSGQLLDWFRGLNLKKILKKKEAVQEELADKFRDRIWQIDEELWQSGLLGENQRVSFGGILCLEDVFMCFHRGMVEGILVNTAFGVGHLQSMWEETVDLEVEWGMMQPGLGILFATDSFVNTVPRELIRKSLCIGEIQSEEQLGGRLRALCEEGTHRKAMGLAAILLKSCDGREV